MIADAVRRGEICGDAPVATYVPQLTGSLPEPPMHELVTHTFGYAEFGAATLRRAAWTAPLGRNFPTADSAQMTEETRNQTVSGRGHYARTPPWVRHAGQAAASAAHMSSADPMRTRLFEPLGMSRTTIQIGHALVAGGESTTGQPTQPWVVMPTPRRCRALHHTGDLAKLATALHDGTRIA